MVLLEIIGMMALGLGTTALVTGSLPVTEHRFIRGRAARYVGIACFVLGLACMLIWLCGIVWYNFIGPR